MRTECWTIGELECGCGRAILSQQPGTPNNYTDLAGVRE